VRATYQEAIARVFADEGGYSNHPSDPGGPTNWGITIADARRYWKRDATAADVRAMPKSVAAEIYRTRYAAAVGYDELPAGLDYAVLDYAIHSGVNRAGKVLRRWLDLPDTSARVTGAVLAAARRRDVREGVACICDERLAFLKRLKTWPVFGAGWERRVAGVKEAALAIAARQAIQDPRGATDEIAAPERSSPPSSVACPPSSGKGVVPLNTRAQKGTAGGVAAAGAVAAQQAHQWGARPAVIIAVVAAGAALAILGWFAWRWRQRRLQET
jgi:lysozyme family protein